MYRFWTRFKNEQERRNVFVVRSVNPLWAFNYSIGKEFGASDLREEMIYILNNLGLQVPTGKPVFVCSNGFPDNVHTVNAIVEKLNGYELEVAPENWAPPTNVSFKLWMKQLLHIAPKEQSATVVAVVDQSTYDRWCKEIHLEQSLDKPSTILMADTTEKYQIASVA